MATTVALARSLVVLTCRRLTQSVEGEEWPDGPPSEEALHESNSPINL